MQSIKIAAFSLLIAFGSLLTLAQESKKKEVEVAPAPTALLKAKKLFVTNGGGEDDLYNLFYSEMKSWARYELVDCIKSFRTKWTFTICLVGPPVLHLTT